MPRSTTNPWFLAAEQGDLARLESLFQDAPGILGYRDAGHNTALHRAAWKNQPGVVRWLLEKGLAVDAPSREGITPLHLACRFLHQDVARILIGQGANPGIRDCLGRSAFAWVLWKRDWDTPGLDQRQFDTFHALEGNQHAQTIGWEDNLWPAFFRGDSGFSVSVAKVFGMGSMVLAGALPLLLERLLPDLPDEMFRQSVSLGEQAYEATSWYWFGWNAQKCPADVFVRRIDIALRAGVPVLASRFEANPLPTFFRLAHGNLGRNWEKYLTPLLERGACLEGEIALVGTFFPWIYEVTHASGPVLRAMLDQPEFSWEKMKPWLAKDRDHRYPHAWVRLWKSGCPLDESLVSAMGRRPLREGLMRASTDRFVREFDPGWGAGLWSGVFARYPWLMESLTAHGRVPARDGQAWSSLVSRAYAEKTGKGGESLFPGLVQDDPFVLTHAWGARALLGFWQEDPERLTCLPLADRKVAPVFVHALALLQEEGEALFVSELLALGLNVDCLDGDGNSVLKTVCFLSRDEERAMALVRHLRAWSGTLQDTPNQVGETAFHEACRQGWVNMALFFRKEGLVETENHEGMRPSTLFSPEAKEEYEALCLQETLTGMLGNGQPVAISARL
jgi:ankyrin repeat protein